MIWRETGGCKFPFKFKGQHPQKGRLCYHWESACFYVYIDTLLHITYFGIFELHSWKYKLYWQYYSLDPYFPKRYYHKISHFNYNQNVSCKMSYYITPKGRESYSGIKWRSQTMTSVPPRQGTPHRPRLPGILVVAWMPFSAKKCTKSFQGHAKAKSRGLEASGKTLY